MNSISAFNAPAVGSRSASFAASASDYFAVHALSTMDKNISLETAEGDKVTLSSASQTAFKYESYQSQSETRGRGELPPPRDQAPSQPASAAGPPLLPGLYEYQSMEYQSAELFAFNRQSDFNLTIEGELSEEEWAEIRQALASIDEIMTAALNGEDPVANAEKAVALLELDTISSLEADYRYRSLTVIESRQNYTATGSLTGPAEGLGSRLAQADPVAAAERIQELLDKLTAALDEARDHGVEPKRLRTPVEELFARYEQKLDERPEWAERRGLFKQLGRGLQDWFERETAIS